VSKACFFLSELLLSCNQDAFESDCKTKSLNNQHRGLQANRAHVFPFCKETVKRTADTTKLQLLNSLFFQMNVEN
jgi:hypothetical protein